MPIAPKTFRLVPIAKRNEKHWKSRQTGSRGWYQRPEWKALRLPVLKRDGFECQECKRNGRFTILWEHAEQDDIEHRAHIDHIVPFNGNWNLFLDMDNLEALCHRCHSKKTASQDGGFGNRTGNG